MDLVPLPMYFDMGVGDGLIDNPQVSVIHGDGVVGWSVARTVRSAGFAVEVFASAEAFIGSDQMPRTACLLVDVQLTGMSGLQLQSHLAAAGRHIPIVFIVAASDKQGRERALELGAVNILGSPSGDKALLKEIRLIFEAEGKIGMDEFLLGPRRFACKRSYFSLVPCKVEEPWSLLQKPNSGSKSIIP